MAIFDWSMGGSLVVRVATQKYGAQALITLDDCVLDLTSFVSGGAVAHCPEAGRSHLWYEAVCNLPFGMAAVLFYGDPLGPAEWAVEVWRAVGIGARDRDQGICIR
ncbi:hypothetical protein BB8028_0002g03560 [Beauveria bassiana]|uniref:Uncharacterized protein n=1 Tax=Beauveria bassiana TaxID=176275 RepID=A0A2S7Y2E5_BEABA|nr:hypothetical protein BB8028_0002g03560 [Beauveria bassiana]